VLGVKPEALTVTGSLKFALDADALRRAGLIERTLLSSGAADRPTWLAASTHPGEEAIVLEAFSKLKTVLPAALLILAPRHPERVASVLTLPEIAPYRVVCHSALRAAQADDDDQGSVLVAEDDIVVVDSLGHLGAITGCADVVLIGGSLVPHGGHNPLEAAAWQLPIMTGPYTFNFARIYRDLFKQAAAIRVDADSLTAAVVSLLADQAGITKAAEMGRRAQAYQLSQGDVLGRQWAVLSAHLP
jgi:3-deoxy-D-manno-octulosonic-acid transferase